MSVQKFQDELKRFEQALGETTLTAKQKKDYLKIKTRLIRKEYEYSLDKKLQAHRVRLKLVVRRRKHKIVWSDPQPDDELYRIDTVDPDLYSGKKLQTQRVYGLRKIGEITVYLPSDNADRLCASNLPVIQQLGRQLRLKYPVLVEFRLGSKKPAAVYDEVLKCHVVTAILYIDANKILSELRQQQTDIETLLDKLNGKPVVTRKPRKPRRKSA